jgi:AraC-like DNA-binding protein/ligand-binding sensor protein
MPATTLPRPTTLHSATDHGVAMHLQRSEIFREYQKAFETTTGLPLALRPAGSFRSPLHESKQANPFCALLAANNQACAACLRLQQRMETEAATEPRTLQCFAGFAESAVPVRLGAQLLGHLQTGQVLFHAPSKSGFKAISRQLAAWKSRVDLARLEAAYFSTRVVARKQYDAVVRLVGIFAQQLATVSNRVMVMEANTEIPAVTKARAYIAANHTNEISLTEVARAVNMSSFYFCKIFRKATGLTFTDYVARVRVETVQQLLLNPHTRVSEAAYAAGFQSLSQFNRVFHRLAGESPTIYRDRLHASTPAGGALHALPHAA